MRYSIRVRASALIVHNGAILLIEFNDENGTHYNLPAGGVEPGESVIQAVKREAREEAVVELEIGPLAFIYEYEPNINAFKYGATHVLDMIFDCRLALNAVPRMPDQPDPNQTGVKWIKLSDLVSVTLYPKITSQIIEYVRNGKHGVIYLEENALD